MTKAKTYIELTLPIEGVNTDTLSGLVQRHGSLGVQELEDQWIVYFPGDWSAEQIRQFLSDTTALFPDLDQSAVRVKQQPYQDWNAEWRKFFKPFEAAPGWWIRPPWETLPAGAGGEAIIIDPQMAFGTGHHETTRLMMECLLAQPATGKDVLDLGSGSGILAIMARKLGAASVWGIDIDPEAVENARHNSELNRVDQVRFSVGDIDLAEKAHFSLILANIHFEVLANWPLQLYHLLLPGGRLIISGLLRSDTARISYLYKQAGFLIVDQRDLGEWSALIWERGE